MGDREKGPTTELNLGPYNLRGVSATQATELVYNILCLPLSRIYVLIVGSWHM